jgi:uncharacterized membrane protein YidH (DUF202 family)
MTARDPGLQPERTLLAWLRTLLAMGVNDCLVIRAGWMGGHGSLTIAGALLFTMTAGLTLLALSRATQLHTASPTAPKCSLMILASSACAITCTGGVWALIC